MGRMSYEDLRQTVLVNGGSVMMEDGTMITPETGIPEPGAWADSEGDRQRLAADITAKLQWCREQSATMGIENPVDLLVAEKDAEIARLRAEVSDLRGRLGSVPVTMHDYYDTTDDELPEPPKPTNRSTKGK